jgi:thymidylate synthase (FAD)
MNMNSKVIATPFGDPTYDIMGGNSRLQIDVDGQHGFVALVDVMPRILPVGQVADAAIVQAARVSYGDGTKTVNEDAGLVRYLMRHIHTTPLEMVEFKFHAQMPIFLARQWIRHRTANVNEASARYSVMKDLRWVPKPDQVRAASNKNKQVSEGHVLPHTAEDFCNWVEESGDQLYRDYATFLDRGVGREQARVGLPLNMYTEWYWKIDLHNLFHFLGLRMHEHAQQEIRDYADAMYALIRPMVPVAAQAFMDYHHHMGGMRLTALEIEAIQRTTVDSWGSFEVPVIKSENKRERQEAYEKFGRLGLLCAKREGD